MANKHSTLNSLFSDIADAIRSKTGSTETIIADDFPEAIGGIYAISAEDEGTIVGTGEARAFANSLGAPLALDSGNTLPVRFFIATATVLSGVPTIGFTYGEYDEDKSDVLTKSTTYGGMVQKLGLSAKKNGTSVVTPIYDNTPFFSGIPFLCVYGCGGAVECVTATTVPAIGQTSVSFNLSKRPDAFCIQLMDQVEFSQYHRVLRVVCDGTNIYGIEFANELTFSDTAWSWSYDNGVLTVRSQSTNVGGYFHNPGTYKLTAFYGSKGVQVVEVNPLSVSENGTYEAPEGEAYNPVSVNIPIPKNTQGYHGIGQIKSTSMTSTGVAVTVSKTGTYKVSWIGVRGANSASNASQLYINNTAYGSSNNSFDTNDPYLQSVVLSGVPLTEGQVAEVRAKSSSTSYCMSVGNLVIEEQ